MISSTHVTLCMHGGLAHCGSPFYWYSTLPSSFKRESLWCIASGFLTHENNRRSFLTWWARPAISKMFSARACSMCCACKLCTAARICTTRIIFSILFFVFVFSLFYRSISSAITQRLLSIQVFMRTWWPLSMKDGNILTISSPIFCNMAAQKVW